MCPAACHVLLGVTSASQHQHGQAKALHHLYTLPVNKAVCLAHAPCKQSSLLSSHSLQTKQFAQLTLPANKAVCLLSSHFKQTKQFACLAHTSGKQFACLAHTSCKQSSLLAQLTLPANKAVCLACTPCKQSSLLA